MEQMSLEVEEERPLGGKFSDAEKRETDTEIGNNPEKRRWTKAFTSLTAGAMALSASYMPGLVEKAGAEESKEVQTQERLSVTEAERKTHMTELSLAFTKVGLSDKIEFDPSFNFASAKMPNNGEEIMISFNPKTNKYGVLFPDDSTEFRTGVEDVVDIIKDTFQPKEKISEGEWDKEERLDNFGKEMQRLFPELKFQKEEEGKIYVMHSDYMLRLEIRVVENGEFEVILPERDFYRDVEQSLKNYSGLGFDSNSIEDERRKKAIVFSSPKFSEMKLKGDSRDVMAKAIPEYFKRIEEVNTFIVSNIGTAGL